MQLKNTSPLGDLDIVGVGPVKAGETFEATGDAAQNLIDQGFERVDAPKKTAATKGY